jgi:hypothetical protein
MAEKWDKHLMDFIKRTGEELKRSGEELKTEAQKLLVEVKDPAKQAKVKEGLDNLRTWAVATGKQAAERIEATARQVEDTIQKTFDGMNEGKASPTPGERSRPAPTPAAAPASEAPPRATKTAAKAGTKSIGRKKTAGKAPAKKAAAKQAAAKKSGASKSIGRKKPARPTS